MGTVGLLFAVLLTTRVAADVAFLGAVGVLLVSGIITTGQALSGFSNPGFATVAVLYVIAAGLRESGVVHWISRDLLGHPKSPTWARLRLMVPVALLSAFMNNTPIVAALVPAVAEWAGRLRIATSQLMIPLSYAAIVGGTCSLIGSNTNLIVYGMMIDAEIERLPGMFDLAWVGVPCVLVTLLFMTIAGPLLLPRRDGPAVFEDAREYLVVMVVDGHSPLVGRTVEAAGLRQLPGAYLAELERDDTVISPVSPREILHRGDRLLFAGVADAVVNLNQMPGLAAAPDQVRKLNVALHSSRIVEAVISEQNPVAGHGVRQGRFRNLFNAAILAVSRGGQRVQQKVGDVVLRPGDLLLLQTDDEFAERYRYSRDFLMVRSVHGSEPVRHDRRHIAALIMAAMVLAVTFKVATMLEAAMIAAGLLIAARCISTATARRSVDWQVLVVIAASLALGEALSTSGAAAWLGSGLYWLGSDSAIVNLFALFGGTALLTALVSNAAAAALAFPVAAALADSLGLPVLPFALIVMFAASASFATPVGYQTNLMVLEPGGYRWSDFLRVGVPLTVIVGVVSVLAIWLVWLR